MKKVFCLLLVFAMAIPVFAEFKVTIDGTPPTTGDSMIDGYLRTAFDDFKKEINKEIAKVFPDSPDKLLRAMGNSSVYASHGATTWAYGGYKMFSATIGSMIGLQLPQGISSLIEDGFDTDTLEKEGDINLGVSPNMFNFNAGLNMGFFKSLPENFGVLKRDNFYIGLRIGYFKMPSSLLEEFNYSNFTLGLTVNYQIIPPLSLAGLITWRGVNVGGGFIYNGSKLNIIMSIGDPISEPVTGTGGGTITMKPKASVDLDIKTFTIPLEATTAIKLLIFNIPFGIGADLAFGKSSFGLGAASPIEVNIPGYKTTSDGSISIKAEASNTPSFFNFKIMTGFGIAAGPVVFDIPITFYPINKGYSFGITIGAVY
jgi:hypothetical protein